MLLQTPASTTLRIRVDVDEQQLLLELPDGMQRGYAISTAANGKGCMAGSYCTPVGPHRVRLKIGGGCPVGTVFQRRRPTGEILSQELASRYPHRDWILTRVLWLEGLQRGLNRGGGDDSLRRFIYIHGTADEHLIGKPVSHGCIRMLAEDLVELFELVPTGTRVDIA